MPRTNSCVIHCNWYTWEGTEVMLVVENKEEHCPLCGRTGMIGDGPVDDSEENYEEDEDEESDSVQSNFGNIIDNDKLNKEIGNCFNFNL